MYSVEVPTLEAFNDLAARVDKVEADNEFIKSLLLGERWLTRKQAMKVIGRSEKTLKRLTDAKRLTVRYEGIKPFYDVFSIRAYLTTQSIDSVLIDKRILTAKYGK